MAERIETICLYLLLAVVGLRPLISERYDSATLEMTRALGLVEDASPITTLVLDGVILLAAAGWITARGLGAGGSYRRCGIEWGAAVITVAAAVSCVFAGNKRLAVNGAVDWLCCVVLAIVLAQLLRSAWRIRLALCVILASGAAQAVECFHQVFYSFPETEAMYEEQRDVLWARQGLSPQSQQARLFEARLRSREAFGYLSHSNIAGAHLVLCGLGAMGLGWARVRGSADRTGLVPIPKTGVAPVFNRRSTQVTNPCHTFSDGGLADAVSAWIVGAVCLAALFLTGSRGALAAGVIAGGLCIVRLAFDGVYRRKATLVFRFGWVALLVAAAAVVGYGSMVGSLPGRSLDFRWHYWTASAQMVVDHPLSGVGSGNFGRHYLQYKPVESPEEVKEPHSFLVSAASAWGVAGLVGLSLMLVGGSVVVCGPLGNSGRPRSAENLPSRLRIVGAGGVLAGCIFIPRMWILGSDDPNHIYFETMKALLAWVPVFFLLLLSANEDEVVLKTVLGFALLAFLIQDTVNFASAEPGTLTTACACLAVLIGLRYRGVPDGGWGPVPAVWAAAAWSVLAVFVTTVVLPVGGANAALRAARRRTVPASAVTQYDRAARLDRWDPTPLYEAARLLRREAMNGGNALAFVDGAIERIGSAIQRDPFHVRLFYEKALCHSVRGMIGGEEEDFSSAVASARRAVDLYPSDPAEQVLLGDCLAARGARAKDTSDFRGAIEAYQRALAIDDARPSWEVLRRMTVNERKSISAKIEHVQMLLSHIAMGAVGDDPE